MKNAIIQHNIESIWHFTDESNLDSIKVHGGLLSLAQLNERGISIPEPGGNERSQRTDKRKGLDQYVHLTFCAESPMLWVAQNKEDRIPNPCWLEIDRDLLLRDDVRFCVGFANRLGAEILTAEEAKG